MDWLSVAGAVGGALGAAMAGYQAARGRRRRRLRELPPAELAALVEELRAEVAVLRARVEGVERWSRSEIVAYRRSRSE